MVSQLPERTKIYQNHTLNSQNWNKYKPREDDIIIATPYKSGTTWMQIIVQRLIFMDTENRLLWDLSPWIDNHWGLEGLERIEQQTHRRFVKSHLPLTAIPYYPQVKYIVVNRDTRDVFMSMWNHHVNLSDEVLQMMNENPDLIGDPMPPAPDDVREFWRDWITKGWFEWESEGYPWWSNLYHTQTWWDFRHLPNILHVHYNDLLLDLEGEIRRVADYLDIVIPEELIKPIVDSVTFDSIKRDGKDILGDAQSFKEGAKTFFHKGTNGRWREVLTDDDLKLYEAAVKRELTPDCAAWLENGRLVVE